MPQYKRHQNVSSWLVVAIVLLAFLSCARMGEPDGGWFDETPPRVVSSSPADGGTRVSNRNITINFDEYIRLDNPSQRVIVSPPQLQQPEIKVQGRRIVVNLQDSLLPNTTYTIDFSDAITDNTEGNPLENYTFRFSTGDEIDTLEVSGYVLDASDLEPVKGIIVGLYNVDDDAFGTRPMSRVGRTDAQGKFVIRGVAAGKYHIYALEDTDADYILSQRGERLAFLDDVIVPSSRPDVRQDTIWQDSLHIGSIIRTGYTNFLPDDVVLRLFGEKYSDRYYVSGDRRNADRLRFVFSAGHSELPKISPINFPDNSKYVIESSLERDTIVYWLRDTALLAQDTLRLTLSYEETDTLGGFSSKVDTLEMVSRMSHDKRQRDYERRREQWTKRQERAARNGEHVEYMMDEDMYAVRYMLQNEFSPTDIIGINFPSPVALIDTSRIHLRELVDSVWVERKFVVRSIDDESLANHPSVRRESMSDRRSVFIVSEWNMGSEYRFETDSAAFVDIYSKPSQAYRKTFKVRKEDAFGNLEVMITGSLRDSMLVVELLSNSGKPVRKVTTTNGKISFNYLLPGNYYLRCFVDNNRNGEHDSGNYAQRLQPETVYYNPKEIEVRAKWDMKETWNPTSTPTYRQKPAALTSQKGKSRRMIISKNQERARRLGKVYVVKQ